LPARVRRHRAIILRRLSDRRTVRCHTSPFAALAHIKVGESLNQVYCFLFVRVLASPGTAHDRRISVEDNFHIFRMGGIILDLSCLDGADNLGFRANHSLAVRRNESVGEERLQCGCVGFQVRTVPPLLQRANGRLVAGVCRALLSKRSRAQESEYCKNCKVAVLHGLCAPV
jgi:hypothetical protein